ncbi:hypothetical protein ACFX19_033223 [Malus domestica]
MKIVGANIVILLLYVNDIIITGSATTEIQQVISDLTSEFDIKDLGPFHYFLRIQISKTANGLFLSQQKYVQDLLVKTEMLDSKACETPCLPYNRLLKEDGEPYSNPTLYRSVVVKRILRYLKDTMTLGNTYSKGDLALHAFSDSDWVGDPDDRRSIIEYRALSSTAA